MGTDKAFLRYDGRPFISLIVEELLKLTNDIVVAVGKKERSAFGPVLDEGRVRIVNDLCYLENPLGGMLSGLQTVRGDYVFVIACDSPLVRARVAENLYDRALCHSAAIPIWDEADPMTCEPLCGVYNVEETRVSIVRSIAMESIACKRMLALLKDVRYVPVSDLREFDPTLVSLLNINTPKDYQELMERVQPAPLTVRNL